MVKDNEIVIKYLLAHLCVNTNADAVEDYKIVQIYRVGMESGHLQERSRELWQSLLSLPYHNKELRNMLLKINSMSDLTNTGKKFQVYADAVRCHYLHLGKRKRVHLGVCFVEMARGLFPDEKYNGLGIQSTIPTRVGREYST